MAVLGCDMGFSLDSASGGYSLVAVSGLLNEEASPAAEQGVQPTGSARR